MPEGTTLEQVKESWEKYKQASLAKGLKPLHAHYNIEKGVAYCETDATNMQEVEDAHKDASVPFEEIVQVEELV